MLKLRTYKHDSQRKILLKAATIFFEEMTIECVVLNISAGGAGLVVESNVALPFLFNLQIDGEAVRRRCTIVWRNDLQLGVSFDLDWSARERGQ